MTGNPRLLVIFTGATALVLGGVISLATDEWWWLILAMAVHITATLLVTVVLGRALAQQEKPDPVEEARLEEEEQASRDAPGEGGERKMAI